MYVLSVSLNFIVYISYEKIHFKIFGASQNSNPYYLWAFNLKWIVYE